MLNEILSLERCGDSVIVESLRSPEPEPSHAQIARLRAPVRHLREIPRRRRMLARAHLSLLFSDPARWTREALMARRSGTFGAFKLAGLIAHRAIVTGSRHIHVHFAYSADPAIHAAFLANLTCTVHVHAWDIFHKSQAPLVRRRLERATAIVTVSEHNAAYLSTIVPGVPVHHVPQGVELGAPAAIPADGPLLSVARLVPKKGLDVLIAALPLVRVRLPGVRVELIGDGPSRSNLEAQIRSLDVLDHVELRGSVGGDEVQRAFDRCSLFVLPCRIDDEGDRDGLPTVLIEALARGIPVITTDVVGISELVRNGETGVLVPPDDPVALAEAIVELITDPERARRLGCAGRELMSTRHSPRAAVARLQALFG